MNRLSHILFLLLAFCPMLLTAQAIEQRVDPVFKSEDLSQNQLKDFEARGLEKIEELSEIIDIIQDPKYDPVFIEKAKGMANSLFEEGACNFVYVDIDKDVEEWIIELSQNESDAKFHLEKKAKWLEKMEGNDNSYFGIASGKIEIQEVGNTAKTYDCEIAVTLKKVKKDFGGQTIDVWETLLCEIKVLP